MAPFPSLTKVWHTDSYPAIDPHRPELSLAGKTVVITGGGSGIGGAIALSVAKAGASRIAIIGRRQEILNENKTTMTTAYPSTTQIITATADISKEAEIAAAFAAITAQFGTLDVLIHNAAYFGGVNLILDDSVDEWFQSFETNARGSFLVARAFLPRAVPDATVLNITSGMAHLPASAFPGFSAYTASKIATARFFDYLQAENPELHVVNIHPGQVVTDMARKVGMTTPIDTVELPADFVVWVASPEAKFLKGKFVWSNWDVEEMKGRAGEIAGGHLLETSLAGWPFQF